MKNILLFVGAIDALNDEIRLLYLGKYFAKILVKNGIRIFLLFRGEQIIDFFDRIIRKKEEAPKKPRK